MEQIVEQTTRTLTKFYRLLAALLVLVTLAACNSVTPTPTPDAKTEESAVLPTPPSYQKGDLTTQNVGWVKCTRPVWNSYYQRYVANHEYCLGLQYGDGKFDLEVQWVRHLQRYLNARNFNAGTVDGRFGPNTLAAVQRAQRWYGLTADGVAGNCTWTSLYYGYRACARW